MADEHDEQVDAEEAPKKNSPLILIVLAVNVVIALAAVGYVLMSSGGAEASEEAGEPAMAEVDPTNYIMAEMQPFVVNLNEPEGTRYLKLNLTVRLRSEEVTKRFGLLKPAVRDRFVTHLTSLALKDVRTSEKKAELREALVELANEVLPRGSVLEVYFTDFVVQ